MLEGILLDSRATSEQEDKIGILASRSPPTTFPPWLFYLHIKKQTTFIRQLTPEAFLHF